MNYKESIKQIRDTEFGIEVCKLCKDKLREINTLLFDAKQAESDSQTKVYLDQLPETYYELGEWLFDKIMKIHDVDKLDFMQGAFVANEGERLCSKMSDLLRSQKSATFHDMTNEIPDGLKKILEDIIRRRNDD